MKAMKKLTAIVCAICISMIGAQAIAANGPQGSKQIKKQTRNTNTTMSGSQSGTTSRTQTRSSWPSD